MAVASRSLHGSSFAIFAWLGQSLARTGLHAWTRDGQAVPRFSGSTGAPLAGKVS